MFDRDGSGEGNAYISYVYDTPSLHPYTPYTPPPCKKKTTKQKTPQIQNEDM